MRIAILGTGALGCLFAARLAAHADVTMLGTWAEALEAIRRDGVCVHDVTGAWRARVRVASGPGETAPADVAMLLVKSHQTQRAAGWAAACLARDGLAVTLQNGLDNGPQLTEAVGTGRTAVGVTFEAATVIGPGEVRHAGRGPTYLGAHPALTPRVTELAALLERAGFDAHVVPDIGAALWGKAVVNAAINPLTAVWRVPNGELLANSHRRALLGALAEEAAGVAAAGDIVLPFADPVERVTAVCRATAANRSSMLQDVELGRPTEIDSINGVIVREGKRLGIATPLNEAMWRLVKGF